MIAVAPLVTRLQAARRSPAKKPTKTYERPGLSEEEIEEIREAFNLFDTDGSGKERIMRCFAVCEGLCTDPWGSDAACPALS